MIKYREIFDSLPNKEGTGVSILLVFCNFYA